MLGRSIQRISEATADSPASIKFAEEETYTADCVIKVEGEAAKDSEHVVHRGIVILSKPVRLAKATTEATEDEDEQTETSPCENALFVIPPGKLGDNAPFEPVLALMAGEGSFSAPTGQCKSCHGDNCGLALMPLFRRLILVVSGRQG